MGWGGGGGGAYTYICVLLEGKEKHRNDINCSYFPNRSQLKVFSCHVIDIIDCINEDLCHVNASCSDIPGSYECICLDGFTGNGTYCEGMNIFLQMRTLVSLHNAEQSFQSIKYADPYYFNFRVLKSLVAGHFLRGINPPVTYISNVT